MVLFLTIHPLFCVALSKCVEATTTTISLQYCPISAQPLSQNLVVDSLLPRRYTIDVSFNSVRLLTLVIFRIRSILPRGGVISITIRNSADQWTHLPTPADTVFENKLTYCSFFACDRQGHPTSVARECASWPINYHCVLYGISIWLPLCNHPETTVLNASFIWHMALLYISALIKNKLITPNTSLIHAPTPFLLKA